MWAKYLEKENFSKHFFYGEEMDLETKLIMEYNFEKEADGKYVYKFAKNRCVIENGRFKLYGGEEWKSYITMQMISLGFSPDESEEVKEEDIEMKLLGNGFEKTDMGIVKKFKTHAVVYNDGEVIFYFQHGKDVGDQAARIERWKERFVKMGILTGNLKWSLLIGDGQ